MSDCYLFDLDDSTEWSYEEFQEIQGGLEYRDGAWVYMGNSWGDWNTLKDDDPYEWDEIEGWMRVGSI